jgi:transcriptional regulator with XRE-family HTH domain
VRTPSLREQLEFIAANVQRLRARMGLTQEEFSEATEIEGRFLQRVERGRVNMSIETLLRLAGGLGVAPARLLRRARLTPGAAGRPRKRRVSRVGSAAHSSVGRP